MSITQTDPCLAPRPDKCAGVSGVISSISAGGDGSRSINDRELLAVLTNKLMDMETKLAQARQAIRQRDFHIAVLEEKVRYGVPRLKYIL